MNPKAFKAALIAATVMVAMTVSAQEQKTRPVDASAFDVAGVRLGMSAEEAMAALKSGGAKSVRASQRTISCFQDGAGTGGVVLVTLDYRGRVSSVYESLSQVPGGLKQARAQAVVKYGEPTYTNGARDMEWCGVSAEAGSDPDVRHCGQTGDDRASLVFANSSIALSAPGGDVGVIYVSFANQDEQ